MEPLRIAELNTLSFPENGEADVVGHGDQQRFVQFLGNLGLDVFDQAIGQIQMLNRNLFHKFPQLSLTGFFLHAVSAFDQ